MLDSEVPIDQTPLLPVSAPPDFPPQNFTKDHEYNSIPTVYAHSDFQSVHSISGKVNSIAPILKSNRFRIVLLVYILTVAFFFSLSFGLIPTPWTCKGPAEQLPSPPPIQTTGSTTVSPSITTTTETPCSPGYVWFEPSGYCYKCSVETMTFGKANKTCVADGASLISIHSEEENDFAIRLYRASVASHIHSTGQFFEESNFWIGLSFHLDPNTKQGVWTWTDGSPVDYTKWAYSEPNDLVNEHVAEIYLKKIPNYNPDGNRWNNGNAMDSRAVICKKESVLDAKRTTTTTTESTTGSTTTRPTTTTTTTEATTTTSPHITKREIKVYNRCPFPIWPGIQGPGNPEGGGLKLGNEQTKSIFVDSYWHGGKIWARTRCNKNMECGTGSCGNSEKCNNAPGEPPFTTAEFRLGGEEGVDWYSVTLADGYNIPILIDAYGGYDGECLRAGGCIKDPNQMCPENLAVKRGGQTIGCKSECKHLSAAECKKTETAKKFQESCPNATAHQYDSLIRTCSEATYVVQFC